jgi:hypothetical protein
MSSLGQSVTQQWSIRKGSVVEHVLSVHETLSSVSPTKKRERGGGRKRKEGREGRREGERDRQRESKQAMEIILPFSVNCSYFQHF